MKKYLFLKIIFLSCALYSFPQATVHFTCPGAGVIAYKIGTSCTASSYKFYSVSVGGTQSATPFYTINATDKEVNGMGINSVDQFLYGIEYDRSLSCVFSNFHLIRYDAAGGREDLGTLPAMAGASVQAALGCVSLQGNFIYSVTDASGNRYIAQVNNIASLTPASVTLPAVYKMLVNNCSVATYADWAVDPSSGKLYSYGIYSNGGVSTGTVMEIDPHSGTINCTGSSNTTEFLDVARDNFGGVYFSGGGILYGTNINTRKLYRINVSTGALTYVSTMSGSGQIRADMGSCDNGNLVLPIHFDHFVLTEKPGSINLNWEVGDASDVASFDVEASDGTGIYKKIGSVNASTDNRYTYLTKASPENKLFRIAAVTNKGNLFYSLIQKAEEQKLKELSVVNNPAHNMARFYTTLPLSNKSYAITNDSGAVIKKGLINCAAANSFSVDVSGILPGLYFFQIQDNSNGIKLIVQ